LKTIGILALQGDVNKHAEILSSLSVNVSMVRLHSDLDAIDGLIIPGGESTTIGKLLVRFSLLDPLRDSMLDGLPVYGTCAGAILLASSIEGSDQVRIGLLDIAIERNAYGPQIESFETDIAVPVIGDPPVRAVFIRAPVIKAVGSGVSVLAEFESRPVLIRQSNILASTFHPEIAGEKRIHQFFVKMAG
jgi:5'-phosphate synthase pdxT subunit